jgi:hypothetical protein
MTPFRYKRKKKAEKLPAVEVSGEPENLDEYAGSIDGLQATRGEENLLTAAYKTGMIMSHVFRMDIGAPKYRPGWKELDFLLMGKTGEYYAIQVRDYDFVHKGLENQGKDLADDSFVLQELKKNGIYVRENKIITISDDDLDTPELAKGTMEALLL